MSSVSGHTGSRSQPPAHGPDPFRYGWRYVRAVLPDGTEDFNQVPLTLEDVLHPEEADFIVQSDPHDTDRTYLRVVFKAKLAADLSTLVLSDCRVDFNIPGVRPLGPDVSVFTDLRRFMLWSTFDVAEERAKPRLVAEITSPDTRSNDIGTKLDYYHRARVPWYLIADVTIEHETERKIELILYKRGRTRYRRIPPDENGRVWLDPIGLWLGQTRDRVGGFMRLACYDPETGQELGDYTEVSRALADAEQRAEAERLARLDAERRAADQAGAFASAEARIRELEALLATRGGAGG
jgi:colicin import membrane protein